MWHFGEDSDKIYAPYGDGLVQDLHLFPETIRSLS